MSYVQVGNPKSDEMSSLISKVKGKQSMVNFADRLKREEGSLKVSAPTLSRAMNLGEDSNPVNPDLLEVIAKVAKIDGITDVTLEKLIAANGMVFLQDVDKNIINKDKNIKRREQADEIIQKVKSIIQDEIASRKYSFYQLLGYLNWRTFRGYEEQSDRFFPRNYDFGFSVSGMSPCNTWKFALAPIRLSNDKKHMAEAHVGNFINKVSAIFAGDALEGERYEGEKYSFVFVDELIYKTFLKRVKANEILVNGLMTAILVDIEGDEVLEETQLERQDGAVATSLFKNKLEGKANNEQELVDPLELAEE